MSVQVEDMEKNLAKLTIQVSAEDFDKAVQQVYIKNKNQFNIPGFRKGKVPRKIIEKMYGDDIFYEDALNNLAPKVYSDAVVESGLDVVSRPELQVTSVSVTDGVTYEAVVAVKPSVTLGQYMGIEVEKTDIVVTDEEIMSEIKTEQEKNATTVTADRPAQMNDTVIIDFEGFIDGEPFDGGKGEEYSLVLGSHTFIDNFEDQLVGASAGDDCEVHVTFPADYQAEEFQGKAAVFKVSVKEVKMKELPEIDDEFASEVSEFETLDEYKASIEASLREKKESDASTKRENEVLSIAIDNAQMEIPDLMVQSQAEDMMQDFQERLEASGLPMNYYLQYTGMTQDSLMSQMKAECLERIQSRLVLEAIADAEGIEASDDEYDAELERVAQSYDMDPDQLKSSMNDDVDAQIRQDARVRKALDQIVEAAVDIEPESDNGEED